MAINHRLKSARIAKGLTLDEVATKVGVSRQTIQRYESGVISNIPSDNIEKLAAALDTTPADLMGWDTSSVRVTTATSLDDKSPIHILTQTYLRQPKAVQDEIIKRLEALDTTFSRNVSRMLQDSGDINSFMMKTGLRFATVGKLMLGKPVRIMPKKVERIAAYFGVDVVEMFFNDYSGTEKDQNKRQDTGANPSIQPRTHAERVYAFYTKECAQNKTSRTQSRLNVERMITSPKFDELLQHAIERLDEGTRTRLDLDKAYSMIAHALYEYPSMYYELYSTFDRNVIADLEKMLRKASKSSGSINAFNK